MLYNIVNEIYAEEKMKRLSKDSPISEISGVGATRQKQLNKLGIRTVKDLIYLFPRAYENRGDVKTLSAAEFERPQSFILTVASEVKSAALKRGLTISKFRAFDDSGSCEIVFFNSPYVKDVFHIGCVFRFYGKITASKRQIQLTNPSYEPVIDGEPLPPLVPIYPLTEGISSKFIDKITRIAINEALSDITDPLSDDIRIKNSLPVLSYALRNIHFPENESALMKSIARLAFDEMLIFGLGISISSHYKRIANGIPFNPCDLSPLLSLLPYELTNSQKNAVNDIYKDTVFKDKDGKISPMARIVIGDVGSGKTICAVISMYIAVKSGYQAALMAPTEILARQHFNDVSSLLSALGIKTEILLGATTQKEKNRIYSTLENGETDIIIGTHSLISDKVNFKQLGLVITDEQHRFGVAQRRELKDKSSAAHMLVMSATPIPRTLALTMYGDLDISRITEMPKGRMRVDTFVVDESYRSRLDSFISKQVAGGGQCYIVCPSIEASEEDNESYAPISLKNQEMTKNSTNSLKNVAEYTLGLQNRLPELKIKCLHGKMKPSEKDEIMKEFGTGNIDVLVSTTVIEVGVNVPNASLMIIENADRFGLSQLHQLRGRVGRGSRKSYCVLVSDLNTEKAKARLEIMRTTYDGYEIAEKDLILRGPGDFFASVSDGSMRQSGGFEFKLAKLCDDTELFSKAFTAAKEITGSDPYLELEEHRELKKELENYIAPSASTIS